MKKTLLFSAWALFAVNAVAQPVLDLSNMPRPQSFIDSFYVFDPTGVNPASLGANANYNYGNLSDLSITTTVHSDASDSINGYPSGMNDFRPISMISVLQTPLGANEFYKVDANGVSTVAVHVQGANDNIGAITGNSSDQVEIPAQRITLNSAWRALDFPTSFNSAAWTDTARRRTLFNLTFTAQNLIAVPGSFDVIFINNREVVGYGQLTIPDENGVPMAPVEVLMIRENLTVIDSVYLGGAPAPPTLMGFFGLTQGDRVNSQRYLFYAPGTSLPVMSYSFDSQGNVMGGGYRPGQARLAQKYLGQSDFSLSNSELYPNPLNEGEALHVKLPEGQNWASYKILSITGQLIAEANLAPSQNESPIAESAELGAGLYLLQFFSDDDKPVAQSRLVVR